MFDGFEVRFVDVGDVTLRVRVGGTGAPVLLLHGHPQTHVMWHRVAPRLAAAHTVVAADLRGYGQSSVPATSVDHAPYSKRTMAADQVALMRQLGFERYAVVGHDRGGRVAYRLALDHPGRVTRLAVLDIVPTGDMWRFAERSGKEFGLTDWHWYFLAQPADLPERVITAAVDDYYFTGDTSRFDPEALADYRRCVADPATVHAMCEDYRAGAGIDDAMDEADRAAGRRISCRVLALWSARDELPRWFDVLQVWRGWADQVSGWGIDAGHFLAEEAPEAVASALLDFLEQPPG
ncbi:MAG: alpha/beta hydrolase [Actinomycetota bacterium]|jgi:haloacetate dehalogenase|nr:alpha/beta hydrolase [Actinomycetota bacterium]